MSIIDYLKPPKGTNKAKKRRGRGQGSGHGKTSCHGHKGQQARGNTKRGKGFEGGQMPLARRIPKRGFTNKFKKEIQVVDIKRLNSFSEGKSITPELLQNKGLIRDAKIAVKILGNEKLKKKLEIHAHAFSKSAKEAIESSGGGAVIILKQSVREKQMIKKASRKATKKQQELK